jgi:hypothetical protein
VTRRRPSGAAASSAGSAFSDLRPYIEYRGACRSGRVASRVEPEQDADLAVVFPLIQLRSLATEIERQELLLGCEAEPVLLERRGSGLQLPLIHRRSSLSSAVGCKWCPAAAGTTPPPPRRRARFQRVSCPPVPAAPGPFRLGTLMLYRLSYVREAPGLARFERREGGRGRPLVGIASRDAVGEHMQRSRVAGRLRHTPTVAIRVTERFRHAPLGREAARDCEQPVVRVERFRFRGQRATGSPFGP